MKKIILFAFLLPLALACSDDNSEKGDQNEVINIASSGTWKITYFFDTDTDETSDFTGFNFTFGTSNVLTASNGTTVHTGTWSVSDSNSNDDSVDDLHFNIEFASPATFEELSDDWHVIEYASTKIKLIDESGGNGGTDYLTFEKN
ncbi:MAG TPA: hypothetical protein PLJ60_21035 [Chryseolinea sp.]|nr:hypothetical protein [Chryseolinea sp.]HPM32831.1 hypothetical protein [Chryseolinea sp.]